MKKTTKKERFEVLLENIQSKVQVNVEQTSELLKLKPKIEKIEERLDHIEHNVGALIVGHKAMAQDIKEIKVDLKQKVDKSDVVKLDHRVTKLEAKTATM